MSLYLAVERVVEARDIRPGDRVCRPFDYANGWRLVDSVLTEGEVTAVQGDDRCFVLRFHPREHVGILRLEAV